LALRFKEQRDDALAALEDIARARVSDRLLALFERLAAFHGVALAGETLIDVRPTQADVASLIGTTRETVSVEMKNLVHAGTIRLAGRKIVLSRNTTRDRKRELGLEDTTSEDRIAAALRIR
jgi:CRP-like cAMP-binding protein